MAWSDAAEPTDGVDRAQVMLVAVLGRHAAGERDAEARPVEGLLDVVGGQGVAGEQGVDPAVRGSTGRRARPSRCGRSPARRRAAPSCPAARVSRIDSATASRLIALGFSLETLELMKRKRACVPRTLGRLDPDALVADDDRRPGDDVDHGHAARGVGVRVDGDAAVHLLIGDLDPLRLQSRTKVGWFVVL